MLCINFISLRRWLETYLRYIAPQNRKKKRTLLRATPATIRKILLYLPEGCVQHLLPAAGLTSCGGRYQAWYIVLDCLSIFGGICAACTGTRGGDLRR